MSLNSRLLWLALWLGSGRRQKASKSHRNSNSSVAVFGCLWKIGLSCAARRLPQYWHSCWAHSPPDGCGAVWRGDRGIAKRLPHAHRATPAKFRASCSTMRAQRSSSSRWQHALRMQNSHPRWWEISADGLWPDALFLPGTKQNG